jgi:hypothetical protein
MMIAQILIAIVITTILSSAFIKNNLNRDAQVKKTIAEIQLITEATVSANALGIVVIVVSVFGAGLMIAGNSP